jgi:ankyrin repeat protein
MAVQLIVEIIANKHLFIWLVTVVTPIISTVRMLVSEFKVDLNACDANNDTPLHTAALHHKFHIIKHIINNFNYNPNAQGNKGRTIYCTVFV